MSTTVPAPRALAETIRRLGRRYLAMMDVAALGLERFNELLIGAGHNYQPPEPRLLACSEDDPVSWWERDDDLARWHARHAAAMMTGDAMLELHVTAVYMRPHDCDLDCNDLDRAEHRRGSCWYEDDGWMREVPADDPRALAAWRAEYVGNDYTLRRRIQRHLRRRRPAFRPVLWGGRLEHRASRLERVLYGKTILNLPGDRQLRPVGQSVASLEAKREQRRAAGKPE